MKSEHEGEGVKLDSLMGLKAANFSDANIHLAGFTILRYKDSAPLDDVFREVKTHAVETGNIVARVFHTSPDDRTPFVPTGRIHLKFEEGTAPAVCTSLISENGLMMDKVIGELEFIVTVSKTTPDDPVLISHRLQGLPNVIHAVPDCATPAKLSVFMLPTDLRMADQWHLRNTGHHRGTSVSLKSGADARVIDAWEAMESLGSSEIKIAVIDDGFDMEHPDMAGVDPTKIVSPQDFGRGGDRPEPGHKEWHGTAVAGVATGIDGGGEIIGAATKAKLIPIRWSGILDDDHVDCWFRWAEDRGADVTNCSWSAEAKFYQLTPFIEKLITRIATTGGRGGKGCVIVFAAGNENRDIVDLTAGTFNGFAAHPHVISVSASTSVDTRSDYSNFGKNVSICAPSSGVGGMGILTSDVRRPRGYNSRGDYYESFGGTSSSAPLVSGVAALVLSVNPDLTGMQVKEILQATARKIGDVTEYDEHGHSVKFGYGCVNAHAAVLEAKRRKDLDSHK